VLRRKVKRDWLRLERVAAGGYGGRVSRGHCEKSLGILAERSLNCDFWYFIVLPPYPLPKTYDGWVRREGYGGPNLSKKNFQLSSPLIV
jgi:hypothetical protein